MVFIKIVHINDVDFKVNVTIRRSNKNVYLRIRDGVLCFTSPKNLSNDFICQMISKNYNSICNSLQQSSLNMNQLHFLGKSYELSIILSTVNSVRIEENQLQIFTKKKENSYVQKIVSLFYANELSKIVENNISFIKSKFHIDYDITFAYKNVKTYFGECFSKRKHVILATRLAKYDLNYILSVIYHEVAHFFYQNHGMQFYALLEQLYPNYYRTQKELRKIKYNDAF